MPLPSTLQQLNCLNRSSPNFHDQLSNVLYGQEYKQCVPNLQGENLVWLVDYLDEALNGLDPSGAAVRKCLRELRSVCGTREVLPTSYTISSDLLNVSPEPFASGGYGDVYEGVLNGSRVCVKRMRVYTEDPRKAAKTFCQEAVMWKGLTHPNILPLLGVIVNRFQLISNWMSGGNLPEYIKKNSDVDRLELLSDVARGLCYLHSCNVVHGDLKGPNILVDDSGHARITDFEFAVVTQNLDSIQSTQPQRGHTVRWAAPEILNDGSLSKEADIFALAMVMVEVLTGAIPFAGRPSAMVMLATIQGKRPPRPTHPTFTEHLWALMQRCWDQDPHLRPEVSDVLQVFLSPEDPAWKQFLYSNVTAYHQNPQPDPHLWMAPWIPAIPTPAPGFPFPYGYHPPATPSELHPLLRPDSNAIYLDLSFFEFSPQNAKGNLISARTLTEPATHPPTTRLVVSSDHIPQWPVLLDYLAANPGTPYSPSTFPPITLGDVLSGFHEMMQTRIVQRDWARLDEMKKTAVAKAYTRRSKLVAEQESRIAAEGVKRVDFLLDKVMFAGLTRENGDQGYENLKLLVKRR